MNANRHDLEIQYHRVKVNGWLPSFQREAKRAGVTTARLLALGSRETNLQDIKGDFRGGVYHGFGVLQVDIGTDAAWCRQWTKGQVDGGVKRGVDIYLGKVSQIVHHVGQRQLIGSRAFIGKPVEQDDIQRIATGAYNCGLWAYYHFSRGENVDSTTTGHDYSRDVYDRAVEFADILEKDNVVLGAVAAELDAQGKYASRTAQERFHHLVADARLQLPSAEPQEDEDALTAVDYGREPSEPVSAAPPFDSPALPSQPTELPASVDVSTPPPNDTQITQTQTIDAVAGTTSTMTQLAAPAESAPGILDHVNSLGDRFQGLQSTLDKFGIANPLANTSFGTWFMLIIKTAFAGVAMSFAFLKDNPIYLVIVAIALGAAAFLYNESRKRVAKERAGVPEDIVREGMKPVETK